MKRKRDEYAEVVTTKADVGFCARQRRGWRCQVADHTRGDVRPRAKAFHRITPPPSRGSGKRPSRAKPRRKTNLGKMYLEGRGVPHDDTEAVAWYRRAAEQGQANAQYFLGFMYDLGRGVTQDDVEAHMWYTLAASRSTLPALARFAARARDDVADRMTPADRSEAQRRAREWHAPSNQPVSSRSRTDLLLR